MWIFVRFYPDLTICRLFEWRWFGESLFIRDGHFSLESSDQGLHLILHQINVDFDNSKKQMPFFEAIGPPVNSNIKLYNLGYRNSTSIVISKPQNPLILRTNISMKIADLAVQKRSSRHLFPYYSYPKIVFSFHYENCREKFISFWFVYCVNVPRSSLSSSVAFKKENMHHWQEEEMNFFAISFELITQNYCRIWII